MLTALSVGWCGVLVLFERGLYFTIRTVAVLSSLQKDIEETGHITPPFWPAGHPLPTLDALVLGRVGRKELSGPPQELSWLPASWRTWLFITRSPLGNIVHNSVAVTRRHAVLTQALGRQFIITREERSWGLLSRAAGQQGCV